MTAAVLTDKLGELHSVIGRDHLGRLLANRLSVSCTEMTAA
jgi:hypothetical protein